MLPVTYQARVHRLSVRSLIRIGNDHEHLYAESRQLVMFKATFASRRRGIAPWLNTGIFRLVKPSAHQADLRRFPRFLETLSLDADLLSMGPMVLVMVSMLGGSSFSCASMALRMADR